MRGRRCADGTLVGWAIGNISGAQFQTHLPPVYGTNPLGSKLHRCKGTMIGGSSDGDDALDVDWRRISWTFATTRRIAPGSSAGNGAKIALTASGTSTVVSFNVSVPFGGA